MKTLTPLMCLFLCGCGITTSQIVNLRQQSKEIDQLHEQLNDNFQVSLFGMRENQDEQVREKFCEVAFLISGEPSFDEKTFAENASLEDVDALFDQSLKLIKRLDKLNAAFEKTQLGIQKSYDDDNMFSSFVGLLFGSIIAGAIAIFVYFKFC